MLQLPLNREAFLAEYWQRRPLLIRNAVPGFEPPLRAEELAGLAMEGHVESRIVSQHLGSWLLEHGPFDSEDYRRDPPWTLLVQSVDQLVPEVAAMRYWLDFLPSWRFDDIMVSYATDGGSVGPHFDRYDVFLLQGEGQRLWRIGAPCDEGTPRLEHEGLQLLEQFSTVEEYLLQTGDALYIPPGFAHWGIAQGECTTFSLGLRAPRMADLMARMVDDALQALDAGLLLEDGTSLTQPARPGEVTSAHLDNIRSAVCNALLSLDNGGAVAALLSEPRQPVPNRDPDECPAVVVAEPAGRIVWIRHPDQLAVFANGDELRCSLDLEPVVVALCAGESVTIAGLEPAARQLVDFCWEHGALADAGEFE